MNIFSLLINGNITITQIPDPNTSNLVYVTLAIAIITLSGIIWSNMNTRKSNKLLEVELNERLKPIIQIVDVRPYTAILPDGQSISWDNYVNVNPKPVVSLISFRGEIRNLGTVPVLKITAKWLQQNSKIKREDPEKGKEDQFFH